MQIHRIISLAKAKIPWIYLWHLAVFIALFVICRIVLRPVLETNPTRLICDLQNVMVGVEAKLIFSIMGIFNLSKSISFATITFTNEHAIEVLWGCSGLRPLVTTFIIFLFVPGPCRKRIWYIPGTLVVMSLLVLLHLFILSLFIALKPELYHFAHEWITKLMVYGTMFFMWLFWEERIGHA